MSCDMGNFLSHKVCHGVIYFALLYYLYKGDEINNNYNQHTYFIYLKNVTKLLYQQFK